jgi:hypothetical protein
MMEIERKVGFRIPCIGIEDTTRSCFFVYNNRVWCYRFKRPLWRICSALRGLKIGKPIIEGLKLIRENLLLSTNITHEQIRKLLKFKHIKYSPKQWYFEMMEKAG